MLLSAAGLHAGIEAEVAFDAALARAGHERDALEHALRLAALRLLSDSLGRTLAPGARMRLHITNGRLIDPAAGVDRRADLYIADGHVAAVDVAPADSRRIGASRPTAWRCCRAWWIYARAWPVPMARHRPMRCAPR